MTRLIQAAAAAVVIATAIGPAHAAVITSLPGGTTLTIPASQISGALGPISFGPGMTFTTSSSTALFGWTGAIPQNQAFPWIGSPAIALNTVEATFSLIFDNPIKAFLGQVTWGTTGYAGYATRMSAYDAGGNQLDQIDFAVNGVNQFAPRGYYGFSYTTPEIKKLVFTNDYIAVRNISIISGEVPAVPEPTTWATLIIGLGGVGAMLRHRRRVGSLMA